MRGRRGTAADRLLPSRRNGFAFWKSGGEAFSRPVLRLRCDTLLGAGSGGAAVRQNEQACPADAPWREISPRRRTRCPCPPRHAGGLQEDRAWSDKPAEDRFLRWWPL